MIAGFNDALDFHGQALQLQAERAKLIAGNIANVDTPGFKARDFDFANALRDATGSAGLGGGIGSQILSEGAGVPNPTLRYALPSQTNLDSNTVDMDRERDAFARNSVQYESTLRFINANVRNTLDAMKSFHQF
jgi:flagellar basal-body rod protein FlgB